ncbi:MAG: DsbA family protein [Actinomycetota bacterium]|nr:DsbA family protein [Actinomycetota bacterium]
MDSVEFFFDPICPWAWITSRWIKEVEKEGAVEVNWNFISLREVNSSRNYDDFPAGYSDIHGLGHNLLRVAAAIAEKYTNKEVDAFYTAVGTEIHNDGKRESYIAKAPIEEILTQIGVDTSLASAFDDPTWDAKLREATEEALSRTGRDVGTPIITFGAGGPSLFGPVMSTVPKGEEALEIFKAYKTLAARDDFYELKRAVRKAPTFA